MESLTLFDTHCHLGMLTHSPLEEILERARAAGVKKMVTVSTDEGSWETNRNIALNVDDIYFSLGLHPHEATHWAECANQLSVLTSNIGPKCVAIGEIGLDFYYEFSPREIQLDVFESQLLLSKKLNLPVILHCRDAFTELFDCIKRVGLSPRGGVMHCFTGPEKAAKSALDLGLKISFSGIITFKNAESLREVAKTIPISELLLETDCPFLTPDPHRGKPNEPSMVVWTARKLAETLTLTPEEISLRTTENALNFFKI